MALPLIDTAFVEEYRDIMNTVEISGVAIALTFQLCLGVLVFHQIRHHSTAGQTLKFMFAVSWFSACSHATCNIAGNVLYFMSSPDQIYAIYAEYAFFSLFMQVFLATLVLRLYVTFKSSMFKMGKQTICLFAVTFVILFILSMLVLIGWILVFNFGRDDIGWTIANYSDIAFVILYVIASFFAVRFFVINLKKLAIMRVESQSKATASADAISFDEQQQKLLDLSAKYILLFVVAVLSSGFNYVFMYVVSLEMAGLLVAIDFCINLFCLYLQFAFAGGHYKKCCFCLDARCSAVVSKRTKRAIHLDSVSVAPETTQSEPKH